MIRDLFFPVTPDHLIWIIRRLSGVGIDRPGSAIIYWYVKIINFLYVCITTKTRKSLLSFSKLKKNWIFITTFFYTTSDDYFTRSKLLKFI